MNIAKPSKGPRLAALSLALLSLGSSQLLFAAADTGNTGKELDITMSLVEGTSSPDDIINRIPLPPPAAAEVSNLSASSAAAPEVLKPLNNRLDELSGQVESTAGAVVNSATESLTNSLNDTISSGHLEDLPGDVIDQLPDTLPDDLLPIPTDKLVPELQEQLPSLKDSVPGTDLDTALQDLEQQSELSLPPELPAVEDIAPAPESSLPATPEPEVPSLPDAAQPLLDPLNPSGH